MNKMDFLPKLLNFFEEEVDEENIIPLYPDLKRIKGFEEKLWHPGKSFDKLNISFLKYTPE